MKAFLTLPLIFGFLCMNISANDEIPSNTPTTEKTTALTFKGGDGSSIEKAVVILGAGDSFKGVEAERSWIIKTYGFYEKLSQSSLKKDGKYYDLIEIRTAKGNKVSIYFDITDFYGKLPLDLFSPDEDED